MHTGLQLLHAKNMGYYLSLIFGAQLKIITTTRQLHEHRMLTCLCSLAGLIGTQNGTLK